MNGKDIFLGLKYIGADLVEEAEYGSFRMQTEKTAEGKHRCALHRSLLVAAIIAMMLLLVGCAVVYVLNMENLKLGQVLQTYDVYDYDTLEILGEETVTQNVLTLGGLKGNPCYQAAMEWFQFKESYDPDHVLYMELIQQDLLPDYPAEYDYYQVYTQEMKETLDGIFAKYHLKPEGHKLEFRTVRNLCNALGIEKFHTAANKVEITVNSGQARSNGNFNMNLDFVLPEAENGFSSTWGVLKWNRKDCLTEDYITIEDTGDWREWNYTTASGNEVLIICSPSDWRGWIFCDRQEAMLCVMLEVRKDLYTQDEAGTRTDFIYMSDSQIESIADAIDFSIQPKYVSQTDVDNQPAPSTQATQDGYTLELKAVQTDGAIAYITIGVTAPEGVDIVNNPREPGRPYYITPMGYGDMKPLQGEVAGGSGGWYPREDGDGKNNTQDFVVECNYHMADDALPFAVGTSWIMIAEDLVDSYFDTERHDIVTNVLAEGEWLFEISIGEEDGDFRQIQFVSQPVTARACVGWKPDGTDVLEETRITSCILRKYSMDIECDLDNASFSFTGNTVKAVMKDGTAIEFLENSHYSAMAPIDLDQVDHILLPDGTRLPVPE